MNIMVVDDEERIRNVFVKIMQREGFCTIEADSAEVAYELILKNPVDVILLDINMMDVDGTVLYEVANLFSRKTQVIVTSVYPLDEQKKRIPGAADYYDKSDSLAVLIQKVKALSRQLPDSDRPAVP